MVLLWKKPTQINKGIIIFTHKEINNKFIPYTELKKIFLKIVLTMGKEKT